MPEEEIDTLNRFLVGARGVEGEEIVILRPPLAPMSVDEALTLAAWLVAITGDEIRFEKILSAVKAT